MPRRDQPIIYKQKQQDEAAVLRTLNAFAVDLMAIPNVEDLFWYVAQKVVGQLNFVDCVIYQANEDQTHLTQVAALGEKNPHGRDIVNPLQIPFGEGITGRVAQNRAAIVVDDLLEDQTYIPDTQPARSEICVPLVFRNRVVGVIDSEHPEPNAFGSGELEVLTTIAAMTSAKLELLEEAARSTQRYHDLVQSHAQLSLETSNRKALEAELFNARKLEAIGRLSGQFAHDFNNLLTVISGNIEFLAQDVTSAAGLESLEFAKQAAKRGATLIRNMLAFSQRARLDPKATDLNLLVKNTIKSHKSDLNADLDLRLSSDLWNTMLDQKMAENALLNLIANAQDAMPEGGKLTISTDNVMHLLPGDPSLKSKLSPGRYVCLTVQDQGNGISDARMHQIFDPFFTTKTVGAGTGLGLSMVLGFVQQSGGAVAVTSALNQGSTFRLYFPASTEQVNEALTTNR